MLGSPGRLAGLALTAALVVGSAIVAAPVAHGDPGATVLTVTDDRLMMADGVPAPAVTSRIVGGNGRWINDEMGAWDPAADRPTGNFVEVAKEIGLGVVRYPGGTVANMFDFTKAIGEQSERGCQTSGGFAAGWFAPTDSRFGPDEQEKMMDLIGGETVMMVPSINRTAADAANYVEYMNHPSDGAATNPNGGVDWAELRAANGHPEPYDIEYWEYGNEPYLGNQRYWRSQDIPTRIQQYIHGGYTRQTAGETGRNANSDGLFLGCDLANRRSGTGEANQTYRTRYRPIALPGNGADDPAIAEPILTVDGEVWKRVPKLAKAKPGAKVYQVDKEAGKVIFGDGAHGAVPPAGAHLSIEYTTGKHDGFLAYQRAMKAVDPNIEFCAAWGKPEFITAMGGHPYDCIAVHSYSSPKAGDESGPHSDTELHHQSMEYSHRTGTNSAEIRRGLAAQFPNPSKRPGFIVSEYGTLNTKYTMSDGTVLRRPKNWGAGLSSAIYYSTLAAEHVRNGAALATISNLNPPVRRCDGCTPEEYDAKAGWGGLVGLSPYIATAEGRALSLLREMAGEYPAEVRLSGDPTPAGQSYSTLITLASRGDDGTVSVFVLNRSLTDSVPVTVESGLATAVPTTVSQVWSEDFTAYNTALHPNRVALTVTPEGNRGSLARTLPPHSITLIQFG